jgi:hypothetical protein
MKRLTASFLLAVLTGLALLSAVAHAQNPLPSWNDGPAKRAIMEFVLATTDQASAKFVPPEQRFATFDNGGSTAIPHDRGPAATLFTT